MPCSKPPTQTKLFKTLQKLIQSYFQNIINIISQLTDNDLLCLALSESAKLIPYITSSRKAIKQYLKVCLSNLILPTIEIATCLEMLRAVV